MTPFPRDDYRALRPYAPDRRPIEVDLSDNTNRWGPHPAALAAIREAEGESLTRYPSVYADDLRRAVAARFGVQPDSVVTGCGSDDILDSLFRAVAGPAGRVAYLDPTFSMIPIFARMNGLEAVEVPWSEAKDDPERLLRKTRGGAREAGGEAGPGSAGENRQTRADDVAPDLIYLCSPNNPTGEVLPDAWIEALLAAGGPGGPVVVLDEAYADFSEGSWLTRAPGTDRLLVLRTFSKAYGLAGLRIGFAVGPEAVVAEVQKSRGPYKVGRLDESAAIRALEDREGWVAGIVEKTIRNRARLAAELEGRGRASLPSGANFLLLPLGPGESSAGVTAAFRERGVAVRPFPGVPGVGDAVRVTVGPWPLLERFLEALDEVLPRRSGGGGRGESQDRERGGLEAGERGEPERGKRGRAEADDAMTGDDR